MIALWFAVGILAAPGEPVEPPVTPPAYSSGGGGGGKWQHEQNTKKLKAQRELEEILQDAYAKLTAPEVPVAIAEEAVAIAAPFTILPTPAAPAGIDFVRLAASHVAVRRLHRLWLEREDEQAILMLL